MREDYEDKIFSPLRYASVRGKYISLRMSVIDNKFHTRVLSMHSTVSKIVPVTKTSRRIRCETNIVRIVTWISHEGFFRTQFGSIRDIVFLHVSYSI